MNLISTEMVENFRAELNGRNKKRIIVKENFIEGTKYYYNFIMISDKVRIPFLSETSNIFLSDEDKSEELNTIYGLIERKFSLKKVCKVLYREDDLEFIDGTDNSCIMQILKVSKVFEINGIDCICASVIFNRYSNRYEIAAYLESDDIRKIERIAKKI